VFLVKRYSSSVRKAFVLSELYYEAINNEIYLENQLKRKLAVRDSLFDFKVMTLSTLIGKRRAQYNIFIYSSLAAVLFFNLILCCLVVVRVLLRRRLRKKHLKIVTSSEKRIQEAIERMKWNSEDFINFSIWNILYRTATSDVLCFIFFYVGFIRIVMARKKQKIEYILHSYDCFKLYLLTAYSFEDSSTIVVTDNHYQRDSYILSHSNVEFVVVQHGFVDGSLSFPNQFGVVDYLFLLDTPALDDFNKVFSVRNYYKLDHSNLITLSKQKRDAIFLASSSPYSSYEIDFLKYLKSFTKVFIIVKLHPKHIYDKNVVRSFKKLADELWSLDEYPNVHTFISFNSYLEKYYVREGINIVRLSSSEDMKYLAEKLSTYIAMNHTDKTD